MANKTGHHDQSDIGKTINYKDYNKNPDSYTDIT